ncbi:MAG: hypothetical protein KUG51_02910, partial [Urechidicola sp.]|nr:hypothetical protein [Urechidicola sp.]
MNTQDFTYLLDQPEHINLEHTKQLENVIATFPYFQSARALNLKGLKNEDSFRYNQALKTTAAYTTDRSILFDFITSSVFAKNKNEPKSENIEVLESEEIVSTQDSEKVTASNSEIKKPNEILEIGKPLSFNQ